MERVYMGARRCVLVGEGVDFILFYFLVSPSIDWTLQGARHLTARAPARLRLIASETNFLRSLCLYYSKFQANIWALFRSLQNFKTLQNSP